MCIGPFQCVKVFSEGLFGVHRFLFEHLSCHKAKSIPRSESICGTDRSICGTDDTINMSKEIQVHQKDPQKRPIHVERDQ